MRAAINSEDGSGETLHRPLEIVRRSDLRREIRGLQEEVRRRYLEQQVEQRLA